MAAAAATRAVGSPGRPPVHDGADPYLRVVLGSRNAVLGCTHGYRWREDAIT